jgi:hypothetical protein
MVNKDLLLKITYNYECIKMLKCQHFHYIDVRVRRGSVRVRRGSDSSERSNTLKGSQRMGPAGFF